MIDNVINFDIETLPTQDPAVKQEIADSIKPPGQIKKQETIDKWMVEEGQSAIADAIGKTALDGGRGHIATIAAQFGEQEPFSIYSENWLEDEAAVLEEFFARVDEFSKSLNGRIPLFAGHNIIGFDLRFLFQRCVVLQSRPSPLIPFNSKPWDGTTYDTMIAWVGMGKFCSQKTLANALGLTAKTLLIDGEEMDGSRVWPLVEAGRIAEVAEYNIEDVRDSSRIYKRMTFQ